MKKERIFWGVFFILGAVFILAAGMGLIQGIGVWSLIGTVFFVAILIKSLIKIRFFGIFFSLAFLGIIYAQPLGISGIVPWPVLGAALLISIGCSMIFPKKNRCAFHVEHGSSQHFDNIINEPDSDTVNYSISFGSSIKYINTDDFKSANLECSFGALKIYFDNAIMQGPEAYVYVENSFGGVELYIPKSWKVVSQIDNSFGGVDEKGRSMPEGLHTLYLKGENSFGGITIVYI